nr:dof zinc finger protein DOF4.6-like [Ipomoea batatas]
MTTAATSSRGLMSSFIPMPPIPDPNNYSSFPLPEFKPSLNFSLDGIGNNNGAYGNHHHLQGMQETATASGGGGRLFFPFEDLKSTAAPDGGEQERDNNNPAGESTGGHGFWNGVLGAGGGSCHSDVGSPATLDECGVGKGREGRGSSENHADEIRIQTTFMNGSCRTNVTFSFIMKSDHRLRFRVILRKNPWKRAMRSQYNGPKQHN